MKPLLRAVLIVDALVLLAFGLLFLLTPWTSLYNALQLVQTQPVLVGQGFGVALIGLAWLALHASIDGALTTTGAKVIGHVTWLTGLLMLVWLLGLHTPSLTGFGQLVAGLTGAVLLVLGLGSVRLSGAVRKRERVRLAEATAAGRAERRAEKDVVREREAERVAPGFGVAPTSEVPPVREPIVTQVDPVYRTKPIVEPVPPLNPAAGLSSAHVAGSSRPVAPLSAREEARIEEEQLRAREEAARERAADASTDRATDAATPRPPLRG
ncbi:hypothetical protein [Paraburkholderia sp.]|uniref:hypothetical protein n=1 Tax=Paraburkholderia sp. TaxID=1926495 RepID=UPI00238FD80D|nr:hypothetical protein [Paraburkholderia sp.]MDE1184083.1 hypothetical protein [Paraburkholderia sp.]